MKTQPYVSRAERFKLRWAKVGELLGVSLELAYEIYIQLFFTGMDPYDFQHWLETKPDAKEKVLELSKGVTLPPPMSVEDVALVKEIDEEIDRANYELKGIIEVGDEILAHDNKMFLSGGEYFTKGKWYRVLTLEERPNDGLVNFSGTTTTNMPNEKNYFSAISVDVLRRDGKVIWRR